MDYKTNRTLTCRITCILTAHLIASINLTNHAHADDWPRFGGPSGTFQVEPTEFNFNDEFQPKIRWRKTLGSGLSSLVLKDQLAYVTYLQPSPESEQKLPESERTHRETIAALDAVTGSTKWEHTWEAGWLEEQEAFGGKSRSPQATPLLHDDCLITVGFTGIVNCLERSTGELKWKMDLVKRFSATPVQFGFSSSPIAHNGKLLLLTGGKNGGLVCMSVADGEVLWNVPCNEASYATPLVFIADDTTQIVFVTRNHVIGVEESSGKKLWTYALEHPGQTNVPTPLAVAEGRLIVSGQGVGGTTQLFVKNVGSKWEVQEAWKNTAQFFYCNWLIRNGRIIGSNGDLLLALDVKSGQRLGRWRGFTDANLTRVGERLIILDGDGVLSTVTEARESNGDAQFNVLTQHRVMKRRCWTPPTYSNGHLYCRGGDELVCVQLAGKPTDDSSKDQELETVPIRKPILAIKHTEDLVVAQKANAAQGPGAESGLVDLVELSDPVELIVDQFEAEGAEAAMKLYDSIRKQRQQQFTLEQRGDLAELALTEGMLDMGKLVLTHAVEDFHGLEAATQLQQQLLKKHIRKPKNEAELAKNGLLYVEFAIRNRSSIILQAVVKGPDQHPFSYGLPFPFGRVRTEKWPVGTKLYEADGDKLGTLLLTVRASDAGKTVDISAGKTRK